MVPTFSSAFLYYSHVGSLICCLLFNSILIICLYVEKRYQLRLYRRVLYIQCGADMLSGIIYYFTSITCIIIDGVFHVVFTDETEKYLNFFGIMFNTGCFISHVYLIALYLGLLFVPLNFYFRYQQLCK